MGEKILITIPNGKIGTNITEIVSIPIFMPKLTKVELMVHYRLQPYFTVFITLIILPNSQRMYKQVSI